MRQFYQGVCLNLAHRGARSFAPENTLPALEKALALGADGFEIDVHMSADGHLVVCHDDDLLRCTNAREVFSTADDYFVSSFTLKQLQSLDAGSWFVKAFEQGKQGTSDERYLNQLTDNERQDCVSDVELEYYQSGQVIIPSLKQVFDFVEQSGCIVNVELKTIPRQYSLIADKLVALIDERGLHSQVMVSSFDHHQLVRVRQLSSKLYLGVLSCDKLFGVANYIKGLSAQAYHPACHGEVDVFGFNSVSGYIDQTQLRACLDANIDVNVWTCNEPVAIAKLVSLGVTALMSDMPNRVTEAIGGV